MKGRLQLTAGYDCKRRVVFSRQQHLVFFHPSCFFDHLKRPSFPLATHMRQPLMPMLVPSSFRKELERRARWTSSSLARQVQGGGRSQIMCHNCQKSKKSQTSSATAVIEVVDHQGHRKIDGAESTAHICAVDAETYVQSLANEVFEQEEKQRRVLRRGSICAFGSAGFRVEQRYLSVDRTV